MKTFDKTNLTELRKDIMDALKAVEIKHGLQFKMGNISYDSQTFRTSLESFIVNKEEGITPEKIEYNLYCEKFGLKKEWFEQEFDLNGYTWRVLGVKKYADRFPVKVVRLGKGSQLMLLIASAVIRAFNSK